MRKSVYRSAVVAAFLGCVAVATAAEINLTAQQKQSIMQGVLSEQGQSSAGFQPRVGTPVPQSMSMHQLPSNVTAQVPATKDLGYIKLDVLSEDRIDVVVQGLDGLLKQHSGDLNENLLYVNRNYDDRKDFTEAGRMIVKEAGELLKSINQKMRGG